MGLGAADEVVVQRLHTPATARVGEVVQIEVTVSSTVAQPATIQLYGDGAPIGLQEVELEAGSNRVVFETRAAEPGLHTFRVVVSGEKDTFTQNNRADAHTVVKGPPRILLVSGETEAGANLRAALEAEQQDVTEVTPEAAPSDITGLASYDAVVLADVPAQRLGAGRMAALQVFTRDLGRGLVMIGGPQSYGAGGYTRTPLEEALPVDMDVRDRERQPDVALVVVIDKSGSMDACHCNTASRDIGVAIEGIPKVDIGKEAILGAVSALTERDEFGVVAFNENAHWVINTAPLGEVGDVEEEIAGIRAQGVGYLNTIFYWNKDLPIIMRVIMFAVMTPVEIVSKFSKPFALAIRLFANMTAGHIVVLALIGLVFTFGSYVVAAGPLLMAVAIMMLELFVAFLQAFIFTLLTSTFIGQIRESHH